MSQFWDCKSIYCFVTLKNSTAEGKSSDCGIYTMSLNTYLIDDSGLSARYIDAHDLNLGFYMLTYSENTSLSSLSIAAAPLFSLCLKDLIQLLSL